MSAGFLIRVLDSKPVGVSKGDYAFHSSEVDQISMKNGKKKKLPLVLTLQAWEIWTLSMERGYKVFYGENFSKFFD